MTSSDIRIEPGFGVVWNIFNLNKYIEGTDKG